MNDNMTLYNAVRAVPPEAQKPIQRDPVFQVSFTEVNQ